MKRKEPAIKIKAASNNTMNLKEIESLIKFVQGSGVAEVSLEQKDFKITIKTTHGGMTLASAPMMHAPQYAPAPQNVNYPAPAAPQAPVAESPKASDDSKYITIKSPMIGTFYRSPSPDKPPHRPLTRLRPAPDGRSPAPRKAGGGARKARSSSRKL